jgi:L-ascorbate metabolism protein UlaG (beta-lactamase superfamily)
MYLTLFFAVIALVVFIVDRSLRTKGYQGPISGHFDGTKFLNIKVSPPEEMRRGNPLKWVLSRQENPWEKRDVEQTKPVAEVSDGELIATFINHATVLIQTEGLNIITDPIYSERASPFSFIGPKRYAPPGVAFEDLPKIDVVLLSHNHYDHMDLPTLKRLAARDNPQIFVPLGNQEYLKRQGIDNVTELDWWDSNTISDNLSVVSVPAQHFSARALSDRNKTLWSGYIASTPHGDIYFAGDTGFGPFIDKIAERFPKGFRLGILPIGAFKPEWFMKEVHISPDEAFGLQDSLDIREVLAIHFGTFKLADDGQDEALAKAQELSANLPETKRFLALPNGGSIQVNP